MDSAAIGYIASSGHNIAEYVQQKPTAASSAGTNGNTVYLGADAGTCVGGPGAVIRDVMSVNPIYKVFLNNMDECPADKRRLTVEEATRIKDALFPLMGEWDIIFLAGGKITGSGYGNEIIPGDESFGWVFLVNAGFHFYEKVFIKSLDDIPEGWRRATVEESRSGPQADQIRSNLGENDIIKVAGGKFTGPGYESQLIPGYFDDGVGWVILVSQ